MREKLSSIFLSPEVFVELFLELLLLIVLSFTLLQTLFILKNYRADSTTALQYGLEKKSYLVGVVISISIIIKILLVAFFTYSLDELSLIVPGAMCGAGVIGSNSYGEPLLLLKLSVVLVSSLWLVLSRADLQALSCIYFKKKMLFFIVIYILILGEFLLSLYFYSSIETDNPVLCCSNLYAQSFKDNPIPFSLTKLQLVSLFYTLYVAVVISAYKQNKTLISLFSAIFVYISYYAVVYFFSAYIYELPTHKCPFCMLQKEYYYIGYLIYTPMLLGLFYTLGVIFFNFMGYAFKRIILYYTIFVLILSSYFIIYILNNKIFL